MSACTLMLVQSADVRTGCLAEVGGGGGADGRMEYSYYVYSIGALW